MGMCPFFFKDVFSLGVINLHFRIVPYVVPTLIFL